MAENRCIYKTKYSPPGRRRNPGPSQAAAQVAREGEGGKMKIYKVEGFMANGEKREFTSIEAAREAGAIVGIVWESSYNWARNPLVILNPQIGPFRVHDFRTNIYKTPIVSIEDSKGEIRKGTPEFLLKKISCFSPANWTDLDLKEAQKEVREAKECAQRYYSWYEEANNQVEKLKEIMREVGEINEQGGPGSRKKVRELLASVAIVPCEECGHYLCKCDC